MLNAIISANINEGLENNGVITEKQQLTKQEQRLSRRQQRHEEQKKRKKKKKIKKLFSFGVVILIIGAGIFGLFLYFVSKPPVPESNIIARDGLHWHPEIKITILGKTQDIPANIGIGATHKPIHTHDDMGVIHLEFQGLVKKDDIRLGKFFKIWGKQFNKNCIFDNCGGQNGKLKMFVNAKENFEFENYIFKNGDKIEIVLD